MAGHGAGTWCSMALANVARAIGSQHPQQSEQPVRACSSLKERTPSAASRRMSWSVTALQRQIYMAPMRTRMRTIVNNPLRAGLPCPAPQLSALARHEIAGYRYNQPDKPASSKSGGRPQQSVAVCLGLLVTRSRWPLTDGDVHRSSSLGLLALAASDGCFRDGSCWQFMAGFPAPGCSRGWLRGTVYRSTRRWPAAGEKRRMHPENRITRKRAGERQ